MIRFVRPLAVAGAVPVLALVVAGCNTAPGAAALVGDQTVSATTLQQIVDRALGNPQAEQQLGKDRAGFTRSELSRLVNHVVIARAAAAHGITVSQTDVDRQLAAFAQQAGGHDQLVQQAAAGGVPEADLPGFIRDYVLQQKLADKLAAGVPVSQEQLQAEYQKNIDQYDQVHSAHILVKDKALADQILAQVRSNPSSFASLAAKYSTDTSNKASGGDLGTQPQKQFVKPFADAIFAAKPGTFIEVHTQFGYHVVHVISHDKVSLADATEQLRTSFLQAKRDQLLQAALAEEGRKLGIHVNPRYGRWDFTKGQVVSAPSGQDLTSPAPTPSAG